MTNSVVQIDLEDKSYEIKIGKNILKPETFKHLVNKREVLVVYDLNIKSLYLNKLNKLIERGGVELRLDLGIKATEKNKSYNSLEKIQDKLLKNRFSRNCLLIGLGGGIIGDLTGFAASTYQRGVDFVLIPTTLLAQVDASVGGKTAINHSMGKNMIGSFHQPKEVLIDTNYLLSLSDREIRSGMVEMIKHGLIYDEKYFEWIEENLSSILSLKEPEISQAIKRSVEIKTEIVSEDEKESGVRALLNLGHTFGHALELIGNYKDYNHGEAVALGILSASKLSQMTENLPKECVERIQSLFEKAGIKTKTLRKIDPEDLYLAMQSDKKKEGKELNLILLEKIGKAKKVKNLSKKNILEAIKDSLFVC